MDIQIDGTFEVHDFPRELVAVEAPIPERLSGRGDWNAVEGSGLFLTFSSREAPTLDGSGMLLMWSHTHSGWELAAGGDDPITFTRAETE